MRNVLVTGGTRGIGLAVVKMLAAEGYCAIAVARKSSDALDEAVKAAEGNGRIAFVSCDLSDLAALPALARDVRKQFGSLWGLVNNAGLGTEGLLATMHNSQIEALIRLNTVSPIILTKYVVRTMMADGGGRVINMSSIIGSTGYNGLSVYGATKASLIGFTKSLAREVGKVGITVNALAPGFTDTELTSGMTDADRAKIASRSALRRLVEAEDAARAIVFLLGEGGRNITGTVLTVDAGNTA